MTYRMRLALDDDDFILELAPRLVAFPLPPWRQRRECEAGIRRDLSKHLADQPPHSHVFIAEDAQGQRVGFIHLQKTRDFFSGQHNAHVSDLVVATGHEGQGAARAMLEHAQQWARQQRCALLTLAVFPGNSRARALYESCGFGVDLLRMAKPVV